MIMNLDEISFDREKDEYKSDLQNAIKQIDVELLRDKTFLITGATGMIGTFLIDVLMMLNATKYLNITIVALGRSKERATARLGKYYGHPLFEFLQQDIQQPLPNLQVDYIISGASNAHPLAYQADCVGTMVTNFVGTLNVLDLAKRCGATVLLTSTVEVYGENKGDVEAFDENYTGSIPLDKVRQCYPESKRAAEVLCQAYSAQYGVHVKIVRLSRSFGPTMIPSDSKASAQFLKNVKRGEDIVLKSKGEQQFSYTYTTDAVSAMLFVLLNGKKCVPYNVSSKDCDIKLKDFATMCAKTVDKNVTFDIPTESEQKGFSLVQTALLNNSRLLDLGWKPLYEMKDAVERTIKILKQ